MAGKFEICKNAEEKFSFIMRINDETVAQSEFFDALDACKRGVKAAKKNARMKVENRFESDFEEKTLPKYVVEECDGKSKFTLYYIVYHIIGKLSNIHLCLRLMFLPFSASFIFN